MLRIFKSFGAVVVVAGLIPSALAFSLLGPPAASGNADGYQQPVISYFLGGDIGGPKNLGEEYRWNTPALNYAFDANFLDYFGSNGVVAVEQAIAIMNTVSNLSAYSLSLAELPMEATRYNYQAQALRLLDLKSAALSFMVEELGLADPDRWTWCLRSRDVIPGLACPFMIYTVIKRNFDPETFEPTSYVNGALYSYKIIEFCTGPNPLADAYEFNVDPLTQTASAVASFGAIFQGGFFGFGYNYGAFWTGLTRDDVGGLRYLMRTNNINFESVATDSVLLQTNLTANQLLVTSNLTLLVAQALTNDAAALAALYPGLVIDSTTPIFTNLVSTNVTTSLANYYYDPVGTPPHLVLATNFTTNVVTWYTHTFANVVTNSYFTNGLVINQTTRVAPSPYDPYSSGILQTNITSTASVVPIIMGDYYLLLSNSCIPQIVSTQLTTVFVSTNLILVSTNLNGNTNNQSFSQSIVTFFTNHIYVVHPCDRLTGTVGLRQGMNHFNFVRQNYDSLLGRFFQPITNRYTLIGVTNSTAVPQTFERVVIQPDFLFTAEERQVPDGAWTGIGFRTVPQFDTSNINDPAAVAGPGTMQSPITIEFNKVGPLFINIGPSFLTEDTSDLNFIWGSFDGSTNAPIIYPSGTSITDLENQVLIQVSPVFLPGGTRGVFYSSTFVVTGGQPPYAFSLAPGSGGLPPGLNLSPAGVLSGVPISVGVFDVVVRINDSSARLVDRPYTITIIDP